VLGRAYSTDQAYFAAVNPMDMITPLLYIGPGLGVGAGLLIVLILLLIIFAIGYRVWYGIKKARKK